MLKLEIQGKKFALTFKHLQYKQLQTNLTPSGRPVKGLTSATIWMVGEDNRVDFNRPPVAYGAAFCSKDDKYVKEIGRRIALKKALSRCNREQRKDVFKQYDAR